MKFLFIILAFYVLILSMQTCCGDDNCSDNDNFNTEQKDNHHDDNDCKGSCIPFATCGSCSGFTFTNSNFDFNIITSFLVKNIISNHKYFIDNYLSEIWQPPKIS